MVLNGIIVYFYGLVEGRWYDVGLLRESGVEIDMYRYMIISNNEVYCVYGDFVYFLISYIIFLFKGVVLLVN